METSTDVGLNRTGVDMSPIDTKEMLALSRATPASSGGDEMSMAAMRREYNAEAEDLGSIPPPGDPQRCCEHRYAEADRQESRSLY